MRKRLSRSGNSVALVLDKALLEELGIQEGAEVELSTNGDVLVMTPIRSSARERKFRASAERVAARHAGLFERLAK